MTTMRFFFSSLAVIAAALGASSIARAEEIVQGVAKPWQLGFQSAASPVMERLSDLHDILTIIAFVVAIFVMILLVYVCVRFRRSRNPKASTTTHNTLLEVVWITVPVIILVGIFIPSFRLHYYMDRVPEPDMTLKVTGYQWYWGYAYPDEGIDEYLSYMKPEEDLKEGEPRLLAVDNPLVVPTGAKVRVLVTAADVIHSFAMPAFGVKVDAIPGRLNETWFEALRPGIYYGQCSELCGVKHGFMPIEIRAVEPDVYKEWVERAKEGNFALDGLKIPSDNRVARAQSGQ